MPCHHIPKTSTPTHTKTSPSSHSPETPPPKRPGSGTPGPRGRRGPRGRGRPGPGAPWPRGSGPCGWPGPTGPPGLSGRRRAARPGTGRPCASRAAAPLPPAAAGSARPENKKMDNTKNKKKTRRNACRGKGPVTIGGRVQGVYHSRSEGSALSGLIGREPLWRSGNSRAVGACHLGGGGCQCFEVTP